MRRLLPLATVVTAALLFAAAPAHASDTDIQEEVNRVIAAYGGAQTAWNEVSWDDGAVVLTIVSEDGPQTFTVGPCATGKYCVYAGAAYTGSVLTFGTCTTGNSVAALPQVRSIANARSTGTVRAYSGSTLSATVAAGTGKTTITGAVTTVSCS